MRSIFLESQSSEQQTKERELSSSKFSNFTRNDTSTGQKTVLSWSTQAGLPIRRFWYIHETSDVGSESLSASMVSSSAHQPFPTTNDMLCIRYMIEFHVALIISFRRAFGILFVVDSFFESGYVSTYMPTNRHNQTFRRSDNVPGWRKETGYFN